MTEHDTRDPLSPALGRVLLRSAVPAARMGVALAIGAGLTKR